MSMSDPIADLLTRIRNATQRSHKEVTIPYSKLKENILKVLENEGYIHNYEVLSQQNKSFLSVQLKYIVENKRQSRSVITEIKRISKPGCRVYVGKKEIPWVLGGIGIAVLTTPQGVMTGKQARHAGVGGEVLCHIW